MNLIYLAYGGKRNFNFSTLGAVSSKVFTVPANKRWLILGGKTERDQSATFDVDIFDSANNEILKCIDKSAAATKINWGQFTDGDNLNGYMVLDAGDYIKYSYGAAQTTPEVSLIVLEVPS